MNLCVNARDAMPAGGTLTITAENVDLDQAHVRMHPGARPGPHVLVAVTDTGTGIPADVIDRIFDPFFTTKGPDRGSGLGLSTALGIVRGHGGVLDVASELGKGSRFVLYLPAFQGAGAAPGGQETTELPAGQGELVLVVDDETFIRKTARATLEAHGYRVLTARDGQEALTLYRAHRPAVAAVVLDRMMPVLDGPATRAALRELDPHVCVIPTSGLRAAGRADGKEGDVFLEKPFTDQQLLKVLGEALKGKRRRQAEGPRCGA